PASPAGVPARCGRARSKSSPVPPSPAAADAPAAGLFASLAGLQEIRHLDIVEGLGAGAIENGIDAAHAFLIMGGLAMLIQRLGRREDFIDQEAVIVIGIAQHIEAQIARLLARSFIVDPEGFEKFGRMTRLDV